MTPAPFRFLVVGAGPSAVTWLVAAAVIAYGVYVARLTPDVFGQVLAVALFLQLFAASTGYRAPLGWEGLDPDASQWLADQLVRQRATGACVVVSSHRIHELAAVCDRCAFLAGGRIAGTATCRTEAPLGERVETLLVAFDVARGAASYPAGVSS